MGKLIEIDVDILKAILDENREELKNNIISIVRKNYIPKDQYENRLKADLESILTDLKLEIEEAEVDVDYAQLYYCKIIQEKINELKGESEKKDARN